MRGQSSQDVNIVNGTVFEKTHKETDDPHLPLALKRKVTDESKEVG